MLFVVEAGSHGPAFDRYPIVIGTKNLFRQRGAREKLLPSHSPLQTTLQMNYRLRIGHLDLVSRGRILTELQTLCACDNSLNS